MGDKIPLQEKKPHLGNYLRSGSCTGDPNTNALNCMRNKDLTLFTDLLNEIDEEQGSVGEDHWINKPLKDANDNTLLFEAIELDLPEFVLVLLKAGASAGVFNEALGKAPIHLVCENESVSFLRVLFKNGQPNVNATVRSSGWSPLHICVDREKEDCVRFLLQQEKINVNAKDKRNQTALYLAIKKNNESLARLLIENGANMDAICAGKTLKAHLKEKMPNLNLKKINQTVNTENDILHSVMERMFKLVERSAVREAVYDLDVVEFKSLLRQASKEELDSYRSKGNTLLQTVVESNLIEFAGPLLQMGNLNPNTVDNPPLLMAGFLGNQAMIKLLVDHKANIGIVSSVGLETILHVLLKKGMEKYPQKYKDCILYLLEEEEEKIKRIINKRDVLENTALHYATQMWNDEIIRKLLETGASIGMKNHWNEVPITHIPPDTMESFLDEYCIRHQGDTNHSNFELTFDYAFLAPPKEDLPFVSRGIVEPESQALANEASDKIALPETLSLWHMSQSKEHRHLLKHPVITSFLFLKWNRIRRDFNRNLRFYLIFVYILTWFIFDKFGHLRPEKPEGPDGISFWHGLFVVFAFIMTLFILRDWAMDFREVVKARAIQSKSVEENGFGLASCVKVCLKNWVEVICLAFIGAILFGGQNIQVIWTGLLVLTVLLVIREFFQMTVSLKRYLLSPENWLELTVIILITIILFGSEENDELKRHLSAVAIVLSWAELITLVGKHPKLTRYNIYVMMFYKVMGTFFFFLCWYAFFIVAFGLGFYIMLHKDPNKEIIAEDDYIFFNSPWLALVKTSTMFVGELEFSDIPINLESSLAGLDYIFFLSFVFLIVVVLMNLLNGLAVSDTGLIQEKAEIVSHVSRVDTISYTESMLLGDPFNFLSNWPALKSLANIPSFSCCAQLYKNRRLQKLFHKITGATSILLFFNYLPDKTLILTPNAKRADCSILQVQMMDDDIIKSAKVIINKKLQMQRATAMDQKFQALEKQMEDKFDHLSKTIDRSLKSLETKMDLILKTQRLS